MPKFTMSSSDPNSPLKISRTLDVRPDDTDARDYIFQPSLTLLPEMFDNRVYSSKVLDQKTEGACVGFALAAVINISLNKRPASNKQPASQQTNQKKYSDPKRIEVSARMLYEMAQRYDEWKGENYEGTSLRGVMKGWLKHGVTTEKLWTKFQNGNANLGIDSVLKDALRRPLGAYYRISDSDVVHVQAAVVEGDAVLASAWVHSGWHDNNLLDADKKHSSLKRIPAKIGKKGLHAFAIVGYTPYGFIIQNSWGKKWGSGGYALLGYDDWFENRQDAWVARPGPETKDSEGNAKIFLTRFSGDFNNINIQAGTTISGLDLDTQLYPFLINTGDKGELSTTGRIRTKKEDLPNMARQVLTTPVSAKGFRHVILYAHGGYNTEKAAAETANRLFDKCKKNGLGAYFFIWETGMIESLFGWLKSTDDATGPVGFSWKEAWESIKKGAGNIWHGIQEEIGERLAPALREIFWNEVKGRAEGASKSKGGANLFVSELFKVISQMPDNNYRIHLVGHSAGSIYLACLYQNALKSLLGNNKKAKLASIQFMAPAISIKNAKSAFNGAIIKDNFLVYMLKPVDEDNDSIGIYPHSILKYLREYGDENVKPLPLLGIHEDFVNKQVDFAKPKEATESEKHQEFEDDGHEIEQILKNIAEDIFK